MRNRKRQAKNQRRFRRQHCWRIELSRWGKKILNTIVAKLSCLSAPLVPQPDVELFWFIKASFVLGFLRCSAGMNGRKGTNQAARNSLSSLLHQTQSSAGFQAKLEFSKRAKGRGIPFATLLSIDFYKMKYRFFKIFKNIKQHYPPHSLKNPRSRAFISNSATPQYCLTLTLSAWHGRASRYLACRAATQ